METYTVDYFGPFTDGMEQEYNTLVDNIESFTIEYTLRNIIPEEAPATANCYLWQIIQKYDFQDRGYIALTLSLERTICTTYYDNAWNNMVWIPIMNLALSTASLALILKYFNDIATVYSKMKRKYDTSSNVSRQNSNIMRT